VLVLVALAIVVDWFAVPDLEAQGRDCSMALLEGTLSVIFTAWFLIFLVLRVREMITRRRR